MSVCFHPHLSQLLAQTTPVATQNSPLVVGYREKLQSAMSALTNSCDHSPSIIDHKFSQILKRNFPRMEEGVSQLRHVAIGIRNAVSSQLDLLSKEQVDRRAIHVAQQQGLKAIEQYKDFLRQTIKCLPSEKQKSFTQFQPRVEEAFTLFEFYILGIASRILIHPASLTQFRSAQPEFLHTVNETASFLQQYQKALITRFVHSHTPIAHHEALLQRIIRSSSAESLQSLLLTINFLKRQEPQFAHRYTVLEHMITEKCPMENIVTFAKELQMHISTKIMNLWKKLDACF
jgi:hypothetical protein